MSLMPEPLTNQLLIALPALAQTNFSRSVALICQHDDDGAMGIVVNRRSEYSLGEVLGQMGVEGGSQALRDQPVLAGGPVHPERGFVLHDGGPRWDSTLAIAPALFLTTSRDILEAMARGQGPHEQLVALGYAGWAPGQLEDEIKRNGWLTVEADLDLIFNVPPEARYDAAMHRLGITAASLSEEAGHA